MKIIHVKILDPPHANLEEVEGVAKILGDCLKKKGLLGEYTYFVSGDVQEMSVDEIDDFEVKMKIWIEDVRKRAKLNEC